MYKTYPAPSKSEFPAVPVDFSLARLADAEWIAFERNLEKRDLLLGRASGGQMGARHIRATGQGYREGWPAEGASPLRFLYILEGWLTIGLEKPVRLERGDAISQAAIDTDAEVEWAKDLELVEIVAPDFGASPTATAPLLRDVVSGKVATTGDGVIVRENPSAYALGGLRPFMSYLDLGLTDATERRMHVQAIRVTGTPPGGTGWHVHSMSQLFYVTDGWVDIAVDGQGIIHMVTGDAMCIGNGLRHNVFQFSSDYALIELCLPTEYSTVKTEAPEEIDVPA